MLDANTEPRRFKSFSEMFQALRTPVANRDFIAHAFDNLEYTGIFEMARYVKVIRADGARDIHIHRGVIGGYSTEAEALSLSRARNAYRSDSRPGTWWVYLPDHGEPTGGGRSVRKGEVVRETCDKCFVLKDVAGVCATCD